MNQRLSKRIDVFNDFIPVKITVDGTYHVLGVVRDISKIGISFYSYNGEVLHTFGKYVDIVFTYNGTDFQFELELLRETKHDFGYICAGKFVGIPSLIQRQNLRLLTQTKERELALV